MWLILILRWPYTLLCNKFVISSVCKYDIELLIIKVLPHLSCLHATFKARTLNLGLGALSETVDLL